MKHCLYAFLQERKPMQSFVYSWHVNDEHAEDDSSVPVVAVRGYGIDRGGDNVCLHVSGFYPYLLIEVTMNKTNGVEWTQNLGTYVSGKIQDRLAKIPVIRPFTVARKQKLYYYQHQRKFPFVRVRFPSMEARKRAYYALNNFQTTIFGKPTTFVVHEYEASPLLQLVCEQDIPTCGWIEHDGVERAHGMTQCSKEYNVKAINLRRHDDESVIKPTIMSFDLEVYSPNDKRMPSSAIDTDCIFQISCVVEDKTGHVTNYLIHWGNCDPVPDVRCIRTDSEKSLLMEFHRLIRTVNPNVVIGYNIFGFDMQYMIDRAKKWGIFQEFDVLGMHNHQHSKEKVIRWSSSAYAHQEFHLLDTEGRIFVDLLPIMRRDYKFSNYKLKTISTFFLGETKDPLTVADIFRAYAEGQRDTMLGRRLMARCGKYCVQDSALVLKLFTTLQLWIGLVEMAKICNVPLMFLFTQGQQIKVYSQVYKKGFREGILIQSPPLKDAILQNDGGYTGAYVFPPSPGVYEWVVPFDFSSLYPTTIIAYNIDYSTLVVDPSIPDEQCHVIEWEDHIGCRHDTMVHATKPAKEICQHRRYRFIREPQGVIPSLLTDLLRMRAETKKQMKLCPKDSTLCISLDKRQLAYKVSANSMYGAMGVRKGYMPFIPGAMCTTAMGRLSIQKAADFVRTKHHGELIYGDSVAGYTPLLIKMRDGLTAVTIEQLFSKGKQQVYGEFKPWISREKYQSEPAEACWIMSSSGWTRVRRVIRHYTDKKMYRVITNKGCVDVTEDHSLLSDTLELMKPVQVSSGTLMCHAVDIPGLDAMEIDYRTLLTQISIHEKQSFYVPNRHTTAGLLMMLSTFARCDYQIVSDKNGYVLTPKEFCPNAVIVDVIALGNGHTDVYDIETECGNFMAGMGTLIVKNTDSIYCHFPTTGVAAAGDVWRRAKDVEHQFLSLFPPPMKLVFEEKLYKVFMILTKKRYMAYTCNDKGIVDPQLTIRGVILARRDNCRWIREVYEEIVRMIMENSPWSRVEDVIVDRCKQLFHRTLPLSKFVITKAVGKDYKIRPLPSDWTKCRKRLHDLHIDPPSVPPNIEKVNAMLTSSSASCSRHPEWLSQYILRSKPAHIQLADKMARRGHPVEVGSRLEFVIVQNPDPKAKQFEKIEDPAYCKRHGDLVKIDPYYYLEALAKPLDQLCVTAFCKHNFVHELCKLHQHYHRVQEQVFLRTTRYQFI